VVSYKRAEGVLSETLDGRAALVNPDGTELITLNEVGSVVWDAMDGERELDELVGAVETVCEHVDSAVARNDVLHFLEELVALGLVVPT
jgi:hypothetical protein